jgi:hypothetical protein
MIPTSLVSEYVGYLEQGFHIHRGKQGQARLLTPYHTPDHDPVMVDVFEEPDGGMRFTDQGRVGDALFLAGAAIEENDRRETIVADVCSAFDVKWQQGQLVVLAGSLDAGAALHRLLEAIGAIQGLIHSVPLGPWERTFREEVEAYVARRDLPVRFDQTVVGHDTEHRLDIVSKDGRTAAEILSASDRAAAKERAEVAAYRRTDVRRRNPDMTFLMVVDASPVWENGASNILRNNSDGLISWSRPEALDAALLHQLREP